MFSRRDFGKVALASFPLAATVAQAKSVYHGVRIGAQSYSFRAMPLDEALAAMKKLGISDCELFGSHAENAAGAPVFKPTPGERRGPSPEFREELRKWRTSVSMDSFKKIGTQFKDAGITLHGFNYSFRDEFTDDEIEAGFQMAKALGTNVITASTTVPVAKRVVPFAEKHKIFVAMHNHSNLEDPKEYARPESFAAAMAMSKLYKINLDIGHFTAANYDPIPYIKEHHARITNLHLKDRKKDNGANTVWGEGDTNIKGVLQLLKEEKYPIPADIEYEYRGASDPATEVEKCLNYCKAALES